MTGHAVVVAGGGPAGTMLAAELTLAGTDVAGRGPEISGEPLHALAKQVFDVGAHDRFPFRPLMAAVSFHPSASSRGGS